jgi:hypothetical protein
MRQAFKSVSLYYAIACSWAWLAWSPEVLGSDGAKLIQPHASLSVFTCIAKLGPSIGCFIAHRVETGNWKAIRLLSRNRPQRLWLLIGPLLGSVVTR